MPRQKRTSRVLTKAELRASQLKAIDPRMDYGDDRSVLKMTLLIDELRDKLNSYNQALSAIDATRTEITELEKRLSQLSEQMMLGVAFQYGKDSHEYEMAGGVRTSDRVRKSTKTRLKAKAERQAQASSQPA